MKLRFNSRLLSAACLLWVLMPITSLQAQTRLAVQWNPESDNKLLRESVDLISESSAELVIIPRSAEQSVAGLLDTADIPFLVNTELEFFTVSRVSSSSEDLASFLAEVYQKFVGFDTFSGIIFFNNSQSYHKNFKQLEAKIISDDTFEASFPFYDVLHRRLVETGSENIFGTFFPHTKADDLSIHDFVEHTQSGTPFLIVEKDWLQDAFQSYPSFREALMHADNPATAVIPLPAVNGEKANPFHWPVFIILLLWAGLAANIVLNATYKSTIIRYFTSRSFFVEDILQFRERSSLSGFFLLFQHAVFGGLAVYFLAQTYSSEIGIRAFFYYFPFLAIFGDNVFSLSTIAFLLLVALQFLALFWLYLFNPKLEHFNQALNIYTWIFHVDYILITLAAILFYAGAAHFLIISISILYLLIWFNSFNVAAFDTSKKLGIKRTGYLIKTVGLHTILTGAVIILLLIYNKWVEIMELITGI